MSKILFFGDAHIAAHKKSSERLEDCLLALRWVFQTAKDRKIRNVVFLGDLFHDRQKIDVLAYQKTFEIFNDFLVVQAEWLEHYEAMESIPPFNVYLLLGNHDLWHLQKWDISSVNPLRSISGVTVIDKPSTHLFYDRDEKSYFPISFLPYTPDPIKDLEQVEASRQDILKKKTSKRNFDENHKILCGHAAVDGAILNVMHQTLAEVTIEHDGDMVRLGPDVFKDWTRVFLGHYHAAQKVSYNIEYVGSPLQLSFGEAFQEKRILIYDWNTRKIEYVKNDFSPQHFIIPEADIDKYELKKNFIRVTVDDLSAGRVVEMRKQLADMVGSLEIKQNPKQEAHVVKDAREILGKGEEMLKHYISQVDVGDLDKDKLLDIGKEICKGQQNE